MRAQQPGLLGRDQPVPDPPTARSFAHDNVAKSDIVTVPQSAQRQQRRGDRPFRHAQHESLTCEECHDTSQEHGRLRVTTRAQCMACHHAAGTRAQCRDCHDLAPLATDAYARPQTFRIASAPPRERTLSFVHAEHGEITCGTCHVERTTLSAGSVTCASCHAEHHEPAMDCLRCHTEQPPESAHPREAHLTCAGAGCHEAQAFEGGARTRQLCLSCHQSYTDHKPGGSCVDCHVLPPWHTATIQRSRGSS